MTEKVKAFIIIDMVKGFVNETTETIRGPHDSALYLPNAKGLIPHINEHIKTLNKNDVIIHMNDTHSPDDKEFEMFPPHCIKGTEECEVADGFDYGGRQHINLPKTRFSACHHTDLYCLLKELEIEDVIIAGVCTDICVLYTAAAARMYDFNVTVSNIDVSGLTEEGHEWALEHMEKVLGVKVI